MSTKTALLVIDVQVGQIEGPRPAYRGGEVVARIQDLLARARAVGTDVIYVQHGEDGDGLFAVGIPTWEIHPSVRPLDGELVVHKRAADAFYQTPLRQELEARGITHLVVVGCKTQFCVDTTARQSASLGFDVTLVSDAHTTVDNDVLTAAQIVAHHNYTLDDFGNDEHVVVAKEARAVSFSDE